MRATRRRTWRGPARSHRVPPNDSTSTANLAYQLLGEIVDPGQGYAYTEYVRRHILSPLGLRRRHSSRCRPSSLPGVRSATRAVPSATSCGGRPAAAAAAEGGLWSCVEDLARWLSFQLREDGGAARRRPGAGRHHPRRDAPAPLPRRRDWSEAFGISWYTERRDTLSWVKHSGACPASPPTSASTPKRRRRHRAAQRHRQRRRAGAALAGLARAAVCAPPRPIAPPARLPSELRELLGLYADPEFESVIRVEWRDGKLTLVDPEDEELAADARADRRARHVRRLGRGARVGRDVRVRAPARWPGAVALSGSRVGLAAARSRRVRARIVIVVVMVVAAAALGAVKWASAAAPLSADVTSTAPIGLGKPLAGPIPTFHYRRGAAYYSELSIRIPADSRSRSPAWTRPTTRPFA